MGPRVREPRWRLRSLLNDARPMEKPWETPNFHSVMTVRRQRDVRNRVIGRGYIGCRAAQVRAGGLAPEEDRRSNERFAVLSSYRLVRQRAPGLRIKEPNDASTNWSDRSVAWSDADVAIVFFTQPNAQIRG